MQHSPLVFARLKIGRDDRFQEIAPPTIHKRDPDDDEEVSWRVDSIEIDGKLVDLEPSQSILRRGCITGDFGVGSRVVIRATNVDDRPGYFNATWELEEIQ